MGEGFVLFGIILVGFLLFCVYFIFKQIEFVLVSVSLYRELVSQQGEMLKLLAAIRDNTNSCDGRPAADHSERNRTPKSAPLGAGPVLDTSAPQRTPQTSRGTHCSNCGKFPDAAATVCPRCGTSLG